MWIVRLALDWPNTFVMLALLILLQGALSAVVFLTGPAKYLFTPMAPVVLFAMLVSYLLSRTLVPVMELYLLWGKRHEVDADTDQPAAPVEGRDFFPNVHAGQLRLHVRAASGTRLESTKAP